MRDKASGYVRVSVVGSLGGDSFLSPQLQRGASSVSRRELARALAE